MASLLFYKILRQPTIVGGPSWTVVVILILLSLQHASSLTLLLAAKSVACHEVSPPQCRDSAEILKTLR